MKVLITAEAEANLEAICDYIARDNPMRALSFVRELYQLCLEIADMPSSLAGRATAPMAPKSVPLPGSDTPMWPRTGRAGHIGRAAVA